MRKWYKNLNKKVFWLSFFISVALIIASLIIPPTGIIDPSVLTAVGEMFAFATLGTVISAIDRGADITVKHGQTEVSVDNPDEINDKLNNR